MGNHAAWLDSKIHEGAFFRHAAAAGFGPQPSADAAMWMEWLSGKVSDGALVIRRAEVRPFTDEQNTRMLREQLESSVTDPAALEQLKKAFPDLFADSPPGSL